MRVSVTEYVKCDCVTGYDKQGEGTALIDDEAHMFFAFILGSCLQSIDTVCRNLLKYIILMLRSKHGFASDVFTFSTLLFLRSCRPTHNSRKITNVQFNTILDDLKAFEFLQYFITLQINILIKHHKFFEKPFRILKYFK